MTKFKEKNAAFYKYQEFVKDIVLAVDKYGEEHVDAVIDEENNRVYLSFHSLNNSFSISNNHTLDELNVIEIADDFNIGWFEI